MDISEIYKLTDEEKKKYMHLFDYKEQLLIVCSLKDKNKFKDFGIIPDEIYKKTLDIPKDMTIGVELEAEGKYATSIRTIGKILDGWTVKEDTTLDDGVEITSPIMHMTEDDRYELATVCKVMQELGLEIKETCGGHIHIGADYFGKNYKAWENFYRINNEGEEIIYKMVNKANEEPRFIMTVAAISSEYEISQMFENGEVTIETEEDFNRLMERMQNTRNRGVNVKNIKENGINTIEFRMPNGTIDIKVIRENIRLFSQIMKVSKQMSYNSKYKKHEFEILKKHDLTEREKVESLLNLLFDKEEEKDIYRKRWDSVKDVKLFEMIKAENPTFKRGDYSMREQTAFTIEETHAEDRIKLINMIKRIIGSLENENYRN